MLKSLTFRQVGEADYDHVRRVNLEAWSSRDYLPDKYNDYMADPDYTCFGAETESGEIVGFDATLLVDGRETLLRFAGRVKEEFQGQGVFQALIRHIYKFYENQSQLQSEVIVLIEPAMEKFKHRELGFSKVVHKNRDLYVFDFAFVTIPDHPMTDLVQVLTSDDLRILFSCESTCQKLFPKNRIFLHCKPFKPLPTNIRQLTHKNIILATSTKGIHYDEDSAQRHQFLESVNLFSIGDYYYQKSGLHYNIELYGDDMMSFPLHLQRHLLHLESFRTPVVEVFVYTDDHMDVSRIDDAMKVYGVQRDLTKKQSSVILLERPFSRALKDITEDAV